MSLLYKFLRFFFYMALAVVFGSVAGFTACEAVVWFVASLCAIAAVAQFSDEIRAFVRKLYVLSKLIF